MAEVGHTDLGRAMNPKGIPAASKRGAQIEERQRGAKVKVRSALSPRGRMTIAAGIPKKRTDVQGDSEEFYRGAHARHNRI